jgi:hypothetical protein
MIMGHQKCDSRKPYFSPAFILPSLSHLPDRLLRGSFRIFALSPMATFVREIAGTEDRVSDFFRCKTIPGGVLGPSHVGPVKVATITRVAMEFRQWPEPSLLLNALPFRALKFAGFPLHFRPHCPEKVRGLAIHPPCGFMEPRKRLHSGLQAPAGLRVGEPSEPSEVPPVGAGGVASEPPGKLLGGIGAGCLIKFLTVLEPRLKVVPRGL